MKPGEFDELVRQKFDQGDFAYNPRNWDLLAEQLDGRAKKRSMLMWLWMPAAGMAASVALAMGVTSLLRFGVPDTGSNGGYVATGRFMQREAKTGSELAMVPDVPYYGEETTPREKEVHHRKSGRIVRSNAVADGKSTVGLRLDKMARTSAGVANVSHEDITTVVLNAVAPENTATAKVEKKVAEPTKKIMGTFREETVAAVKKPQNFSVILSGGVNQGSNNNGYMAGATVRKMINEKVYIEGDIAFASSNNVQRTDVSYAMPATGNPSYAGGTGTIAAKSSSASKITATTDGAGVIPTDQPVTVVKTQDVSYNLKYAQITPSIGYRIMKRMSIGLGPDFQQMLVDNRPAPSTVTRENIQVAPSFDVGFVGKTEYAFTSKVRAAVAYRKGINGFINPGDKFIDRNYLQFQMKCTIFNK